MEARSDTHGGRVGSVARDPSTFLFRANWSDEADNHEDGGEFADVEQAIAWARARAPVVIVVLGFSSPMVFSAGEQYDPGEDPEHDPLRRWPPTDEVLAKLLSDREVRMLDWGRVDVVADAPDEGTTF